MMLKLLLACIVIFILWRSIYHYKKLPPKKQKGFAIKALISVLIGAAILGAITGRMHWLGGVIAALIPLLRFGAFKLVPLWLNQGGGIVPIKTQFLTARVQVKTGHVEGQITKGPHKGRSISSLTQEELQSLLEHYKNLDSKSYYVIKVILNKGSQQSTPPPPSSFNQDYEEALQTLGLTGTPTKEDIIKAHRRLINKLHPDRGGSDFLAARVNQARDVLVDHIESSK